MPKMKTHSGAKKRFRVTGKGKMMRRAVPTVVTYSSTSPAARTRRLAGDVEVSAADTRKVKKLLGKLVQTASPSAH